MTPTSGAELNGEYLPVAAGEGDVTSALVGLPGRDRRLAVRRLAHARADHARTGDPAAVERVVASLLLTVGLRRNPEYAQALTHPSPSMEAMDVAEVVARLEERDRDRTW